MNEKKPKLDQLLNAWDEGHSEFALAFHGLEDRDLWCRPDPKLLSIGELAGHVVHWEAVVSENPRVEFPIESPLIDGRFSFYTSNVDVPVSLNLGVADVLREMKRVHEIAKAELLKLDPAFHDPIKGNEEMTWGRYLRYRVIHVAYHCGQAYSVRHLMGHETTDN
jgi:hypothetical protein